MKKIFLITAYVLFCNCIKANPISDSLAKIAGLHFLNTKAVNPVGYIETGSLKLAYTEKETENYYYIYTINSNKGFIIVAANDNALPILGYSFNNGFNINELNSTVAYWMDGYKKQMQIIVEKRLPQSVKIKAEWDELLGNNDSNINNSANKAKAFSGVQPPQNGVAGSVLPLIKTVWDQNAYDYINYPSTTSGISGSYNDFCPMSYVSYPQRTVTGCVATAMAQIMKFWNYPTHGNGNNSYSPSNKDFGTLSANFGNTAYQWNLMPDSLTLNSTAAQTNAVATLMYHCGLAVNMDYGLSSGAGSIATMYGAYPSAQYALKNNFGYSNVVYYTRTGNFTDPQWINLLETEISAGRPVMYDGHDTARNEGHCFIADGYDVNNNIHFNWGWSGYCNGYFQVNALNPGLGGIGGGNGQYNSNQHILTGIQPTPTQLQLYNSQVILSATTINYGTGFTVTANINNYSSNTFTGDFSAAVSDSLNNIVSFLSLDSNQTLSGNAHFPASIIFSTQGISTLMPGKYSVSIYYRPTGGSWAAVENNGVYVNKTTINVINTDSIALFSPINITTGNLITGNPAGFSFNIINNSKTLFKGNYQLSIYSLNGNLIQSLGTYNDAIGLTQASNFSSPVIFNTTSLNITPGNYLLGLKYQPAGTSASWKWVGADIYKNPIPVNVSLQPDIYESNDSVNKSSVLTPAFINDIANVYTTAANIQIGTDQDYYKVKLPAGYNYTVRPVLNSVNYSDNNNTYTLNGKFSFSTDSLSWSGALIDTVQNRDTVLGGTTIFFHVFSADQTGSRTYLLELNIKRISNVISGFVQTPSGVNITNYSLKLYSNIRDTIITGSGNYSVNLIGTKDTLYAVKNNDVLKTNGITALDIALTQGHILGKNIFNSPYKLVAADVNGDNTVSALDIVYIKRLILGIDTTFTKTSNGAKRMWVFIDSDNGFNLADSANAFSYYSSRFYNNTTRNRSDINFIGCKLGDVNWDWNPAVAKPDNNAENSIEFSYSATNSKSNDGYIHIPVKVKNFKNILGMQFTLNFNPHELQWQGIVNNPLAVETGITHALEGSVSFLWIDPNNEIKTLEDGSVIMELVFFRPSSIVNCELSIDGNVTAIAAYDKDCNLHGIVMKPTLTNNADIVKEKWSILPNPVIDRVINIQMSLKENKVIVFRLLDNTGRVILVKQVAGIKGNNTISFREESNTNGTYYIQAVGIEGEDVKEIL